MILSFTLLAAAALCVGQPEPRNITWADLIPKDQVDTPAPPRAAETHTEIPDQVGSAATVKELDGAYIRMPGFMLPLDYTDRGKVSAFLLVPYYGACIHVPPPPPNQIVFVDTGDEPAENNGLWDPVWVTGTMRVVYNDNDLGDAAYTLELDVMEPYRE